MKIKEKKGIPRSVYIKFLVLLCLIGLTALALRPIQTALSREISNIRTNLIERLETATGFKIHYSSIRPDFFNSFDIRNLKFIKDDREILTISRARFYFSIKELFLNRKISFNTIQIDRPVINLDLEKEKDTLSNLANLFNSSNTHNNSEILGQLVDFFPQKANYRIRNCYIYLTTGNAAGKTGTETSFQIVNMNVNIRADGSNFNFDTQFGAEVTFNNLFNRTLIFNSEMFINGEYLFGLQEARAQISLLSLTCSEVNSGRREESFFMLAGIGSVSPQVLFTLQPIAVNFSYKEKTINVKKHDDNESLDYQFIYDLETRTITADLGFSAFMADSFVNFSDCWKNVSFLNIATTGNLSIKYFNDRTVEYYVNMHGGNLKRRSSQDSLPLSEAYLIRAYGNNQYIFVNDFCLNMSEASAKNGFFQGIVNFSGNLGFSPFRPAGTVSIDSLSFTGKETVNGVFSVTSSEKEIQVSSVSFSIGSFSLKSLDMFLYPSENDIGITLEGLCEDNGTLYLDAFIDRIQEQTEVSLALDSFSVISITEIIRPFTDLINIPFSSYLFSGNTLIDTEIFFSSDLRNIVYNVPEIVIRRDSILALLSVSGTDRYFTLREGILYMGENELTVFADANFANQKDIDFTVNASYLDLSWNVEGQLLDRTTLIVNDPNGLHFYGNTSDSGAFSGYIECINFPLPAKVSPVYTDLYVNMRYNSVDSWSANVSHLKVRNLYSPNGFVDFSVSGSANQNGASFRNILYSDNIGDLAGGADFFWNTDFTFYHFIVNITDGKNEGEYYFLEGIFKDRNLDVNTSVTDMRIDRFLKRNGIMTASANAKLSWNSIDSFNAQIDLSSFSAVLQRNTVNVSANAQISNEELLLQNLTADIASVRTVMPLLKINRREGIAKATAEVSGISTKRRLEGKVDINADFNSIKSWVDIKHAFDSFNGTLQVDNIHYGDLSQDRVIFTFTADEQAISLFGGIRDMLRLEMDREGNFYASLSEPLPVRGSFAGIFKEGNLDVNTNDFYIDMAMLYDLTSNASRDNFNINGGYITGRMNIKGPLRNPEFFGTGRSTSLSLQVPGFVSEDIRPVPFNILAEGEEITFGPIVAVSGKGSSLVNGWLRFENWIPKNIGLDITIPRDSPVPYNIDAGGFLASGDASGRLDFGLNLNDRLIEVRGGLNVNNTEMGLNMDKITAGREEPSEDRSMQTIVEISITAGTMVEFFWPSINSPFLRVNPELGTVVTFSYDSLAGQYLLNSDVRFRSGEIYYLDRYFYIRQGNIVFRENELQFDPRINLRAEIRDRADSGPVTISMIIENEPLLSFEPRFEASPSLTQVEIYSILGQNLNSTHGNDTDFQRFLLTSSTDLMAQFVAGSDVLAQIIFMRQFERRVRNFLNLDMLSIRTRFLQNAVVSGTSAFAQLPVDRIYRVGNYFDNTTVFTGKYVGQDMFIHGTFSMKYDENRNVFSGLRFEPDIGIELQSPVLNIRWNFFPYHPENWWVNDNSITLIWSKSF